MDENEFVVDISKSPIFPSNISVSEWGGESKKSKEGTLRWEKYIEDYKKALSML